MHLLCGDLHLFIHFIVAHTVSARLRGVDPDKDGFTFHPLKLPDSQYINSTTLKPDGALTFSDICGACTGKTTVSFISHRTARKLFFKAV